jgi:hypothetical protein
MIGIRVKYYPMAGKYYSFGRITSFFFIFNAMSLQRLLYTVVISAIAASSVGADELSKEFASPPSASRCWTYWYWHISATKEGITRDLKAMHEQGIEGVLTFPFGEYMKPDWIPMFQHVLAEADRLQMKIVLNNDSFWSCQVPWMTKDLAEKKIVHSENIFEGGRDILEKLPSPTVEAGFYRDIVVLAYPLHASSENDPSAQTDEGNLKTAKTMPPSYAAGALDAFYAKSPHSAEKFPQAEMVQDISDKMQSDGRLDWHAPSGRWLVLRFGYTILNPACPDFFNRDALDHHLNQSIEKLLPLAGKHVGKVWTHVHEDSYENGSQTWTPAFREEFCKRRGYDMTPWMPTLAGRSVGNRELTDRFLHDYRTTISDLYVENHFGHFAKRLSEHDLKFSNEGGYGWASAIADGLRIEAFADIPMGEFWHAQRNPVTGELLSHQFHVHGLDPHDTAARRAIPYGFGLNSIRLAASASHIYGKPYCQAESFTSYTQGSYDLCNSPYSIKATGDRAFCDGLGRIAFHVFDLQSDKNVKPDQVWLGIGIHFNRNITWWKQAKAFTDYLARCQFMLRQGKFVADFAYWTGDTMPYECPDRLFMRPALPRGCNADLVNTDVLVNRMTVKDNRLTLPDGLSYRYLVLPPTRESIQASSLRKIKELIEAGATVVLGPRPISAAGLENYPKCDAEIEQLAATIWGSGEIPASGVRQIGNGRAVWGFSLTVLLQKDGISPDVETGDRVMQADFEWIHYRDDERDLYFVSNQSLNERTTELRFRAIGKQIVLWDPIWGTRRILPEWKVENGVTTVPMCFAPQQSFFVTFEHAETSFPPPSNAKNFPECKTLLTLNGKWQVSFDPKWGGPGDVVFDNLQDWTTRSEESIKYYSGTATYRKSFDLPKNLALDEVPSPIYLDLGTVKDLAEVRLNGKHVGTIWTAPWRIDVRGALKASGNELKIDVINQWPNRLIGDANLSPKNRLTQSNYQLKPDSPLVSSGLLGPVTLQIEK